MIICKGLRMHLKSKNETPRRFEEKKSEDENDLHSEERYEKLKFEENMKMD